MAYDLFLTEALRKRRLFFIRQGRGVTRLPDR